MHRRIGILGGLTPESTVTYYQRIVRRYQELHGDHAFPEIVIYSVSFQRYEDWMEAGQWEPIAEGLLDGLRRLAVAGADFAVMATNTMHLLFDQLLAASPIPLLSIIDATAAAIAGAGLDTIGLLGTRFTMEQPFYADALARQGIRALAPTPEEVAVVHRIIMTELSFGFLREESRRVYLDVVDALAARGAQGIVLGCTEIPLLVRPEHTPVPLFDTAILHADAALALATTGSG